jgi:hypothetical protein
MAALSTEDYHQSRIMPMNLSTMVFRRIRADDGIGADGDLRRYR